MLPDLSRYLIASFRPLSELPRPLLTRRASGGPAGASQLGNFLDVRESLPQDARRILTKYAAYYNELTTHRSLNKDAPIYRAIQHVGCIVSAPVLGGLHHHYCRI